MLRDLVSAILCLVLLVAWSSHLAAEPRQPPTGAAQRLREMAARQGHGAAAEHALRNLGYEVPWADEENGRALAERVRVSRATNSDALITAIQPLAARELSRECKQEVTREFRRVHADLEAGRGRFAAVAFATTRIPADRLLEILRKDRLGDPLADQSFLDSLSALAGRPLNARESRDLQSADEARLADVERLDQASAVRLARLIGFQAGRR